MKDARLDAEIAIAMDGHLASVKEDRQRPFLSYYKTLVESVDDAAAEMLAEVLATGGPTIENFVHENIVTFGTFFKVHPEIQETILDTASNKDLAAILAGLSEGQAQVVRGLLTAKRIELVEEELERIQAKGRRAIEQAFDQSKKKIVKKLISSKGEGTISEMLSGRASESQENSKTGEVKNLDGAA